MHYIARINKVVDDKRYLIEVEVPTVYENVTAYPLSFLNEPRVGDEVFLFEMGKDLFTYLPIRTKEDDIQWRHKDNLIKFNEDKRMDIISKDKIQMASKGEMTLSSTSDITMQSKGKISILNSNHNLRDILVNMMMTYMSTVTVLGGPLTPNCIEDAVDIIKDIDELLS